jgi:predicted nucleotidyltransferase
MATYARAWRHAWEEDARRRKALALRARALLPHLVELLVEEWGARRVFLIGSLARGEFGDASDIDLVAEGLALPSFYEACAAIERAAGGEFHVDLVPLESARPFVRDLVSRGEAEVLYDDKAH